MQFSVILLGASLNFNSVLKQGASGLGLTVISIGFVFVLGLLGARWLGIDKNQGTLITMGTAICGGSAIGALAPVLRADALAIAVSMGVVFILNALAVFVFPPLGESFALSQEQFGLWSALAIHDTSSVVAASSIYGDKALEVATTVKLTRALWIIPISLAYGFFAHKEGKAKIKLPWFIVGFLALSLLFTFIDLPPALQSALAKTSKLGFAATLFLIGLTFNISKIKQMGIRPLLFGVSLWLIVTAASLGLVRYL